VSAPSLVILLELEAAPRLLCNYVNESEERRLANWLAEAHAELLGLVVRALELRDELEAA
jgi:hypothetical protein